MHTFFKDDHLSVRTVKYSLSHFDGRRAEKRLKPLIYSGLSCQGEMLARDAGWILSSTAETETETEPGTQPAIKPKQQANWPKSLWININTKNID